MPRSFTAAFSAAAASKSAKPYQVLQISWASGDVYYLDRPSNSFSAAGARVPASGVDPNVLVMTWPSVSLSLKEGEVGATDQTQVVLNDASGALTSLLTAVEQQRRLVRLWRMFDDPSVVWGTDNALILAGVLRPFGWTAKDNQLTLAIGDLGPLLAKSISCTASKHIFTGISSAYQDRQLPIAWGNAQRVEAVCVQQPFRTTIVQATDGSSPITVTIADDPDSMGVDGTGATSYNAWLGTDAVSVTFTQSALSGTSSSTATITTSSNPVIATAVLMGTVDGSGSIRLILQNAHIVPVSMADSLQDFVASGTGLQIIGAKGIWTTTVTGLTTDSPWSGWYTITINDPGGTIIPNLEINDQFRFLSASAATRAWPAGTMLKQSGVKFVYVCSALPSKNVSRVEGYGSIADQAGNGRKDFVALGSYALTIISGSATTRLTGDTFKVNLNDNTWNNPLGTLLGQNVTTLTIDGFLSPRDINPNLEDDRLWITLQGVEDAGNSTGNLITNPALILLQYLENPHLMNVDPSSINQASFATAAAALAGYSCGFAQIEAEDGLTLLQHIAGLCHSVIFFDQGQANMVVLSDYAGAVQWTGDMTTHDNLSQGSLSQSESAVDSVINDLNFKWRGYWDDKTGQKLLDSKNVKLTSIAAFGRMAREIQCDIFWRREDVAEERDWWLGHLSSLFHFVTFTAFLGAIVLQPGDAISVTWIDGGGRNLFGGAKTMIVTKTTDTGKDGLVQIEARFVIFAYS